MAHDVIGGLASAKVAFVTSEGHLLPIEPAECRQLLAERTVGRVAWHSSQGLVILPLNYAYHDGHIIMRVSAKSILAELSDGPEAAFEVEDLDDSTLNGWTVLVRGTTAPYDGDVPVHLMPWAPGDRDVLVSLAVDAVTGRSVMAD